MSAAPADATQRLIAIGASAGGPTAIATVLGGLPAGMRAAVVLIQHLDRGFAAGMADWLDTQTILPVRVAEENDQPTHGHVLLSGAGDHLIFKQADRLGYTIEPAETAYRPSIDVFFESVCRLWPGEVIGVLLTGMGRDGAVGLKALRDRGHHTIAQDEASSAVYGMPKAAVQIHAAVESLAIDQIAPRLSALVHRR